MLLKILMHTIPLQEEVFPSPLLLYRSSGIYYIVIILIITIKMICRLFESFLMLVMTLGRK